MKKLSNYIKKRWFLWLLIVAFGFVLWINRYDIAEWVWTKLGKELPQDPRPAGLTDLQWCEQNYKDEMADISENLGLPYEYLMSLAVLECGGNKPAGNRFEKHVFNQLKKVRDGHREKYESIRQKDLIQLDDEGLKNLATSWGPFQLMGYKVIQMGLNIKDIRDEEDAALYGAKWIKDEYGNYLAKKKWKDAFHIHNTGKRFPISGRSKTHDPYYVSDGIKYMKYFEKNSPFPMIKQGTKRVE